MINKYEWDFTDIYKGKEEYKKDIELIEQKLEEISKYKAVFASTLLSNACASLSPIGKH